MGFRKINFPHIILLVAIALGALIRIVDLDDVPLGYTFDEVGIAYDAWSIASWHRDQFANFMPLSFKSFGDYKPPVMIYFTALIYLITGPQLIVPRLISAISGIGSIAISFYLAKIIFPNAKLAPSFTALIIALSPWSLHLSRIGFEQNLAFLFGISGITLWFKGRNSPWFWTPAGIISALAMYTFHTAKIFVPITIMVFFWTYRLLIKKFPKQAAIGLGGFVIAVVPLLYDSIFGSASARAETIALSLIEIGKNITNYLSPQFWIMGWDGVSVRHAVAGYGVLLWPTYLIMLGAIFILIKNKNFRIIYWPLTLIGLGLLPGIITQGSPHVIRTQFGIIGAALLAGFGYELIAQFKRVFYLSCVVIIGVFSVYMIEYFGQYPQETATAFQYGYKEVLEVLKDQPQAVITITDNYGQPYIYVLFHNQISAQSFLWGGLNNYQFRSIRWPETQPGIYAGTPQEIPIDDPSVINTVVIPTTNQVVWVIARI